MAARNDRMHSERVRARIQLSQLVTRLQKNALGQLAMSDGERDSAKFLIARAMPPPPEQKDLNVNGQITVNIKRYGP